MTKTEYREEVDRLDIQLLKSFLAIAESPTLSSAAKSLDISQPTMSLQMKRLEDRIGQLLFEPGRRGKPLRLSVNGERLVVHAKRILEAHEEAVLCLTQPEDLRGPYRIGIPSIMAQAGLYDVLTRFMSIYENVELSVMTADMNTLKEMVKTNEIDARICISEEHEETANVLWDETFHWVCAPDFELRSDQTIPIAIGDEKESVTDYIIEKLDSTNINWQNVYSSDCMFKIYSSVASGHAVAAVPASLISNNVRIMDDSSPLPTLDPISFALYGSEPEATKRTIMRSLNTFLKQAMSNLADRNALN